MWVTVATLKYKVHIFTPPLPASILHQDQNIKEMCEWLGWQHRHKSMKILFIHLCLLPFRSLLQRGVWETSTTTLLDCMFVHSPLYCCSSSPWRPVLEQRMCTMKNWRCVSNEIKTGALRDLIVTPFSSLFFGSSKKRYMCEQLEMTTLEPKQDL